MKKFILIILSLTVLLACAIVYEKWFVQSQFGPSSMLAVGLLGLFALLLSITLISIGSRFQEPVGRAWLIMISLGTTFLIVDLITGAILIKPLSPELAADQVRHHKLVPNTHSRFEQQDFSYIQRVNNLGLRGPDQTTEKPEGYYRILMLGDSFTMGKGVEDSETFSALIEKSLNNDRRCEKTVEILNGGTDSYTPILSYLQLQELISLSPDRVILNLDVSDLVQEAAYRNIAQYDENGNIIGVPGSQRKLLLNERLRAWIDQNMFFTRLILYYTNKLVGHKDLTVRSMVTQANLEIVQYTLEEDTIDRSKQWKDLFQSVKKIKQLTDEKSIPFSLIIYPWGHQVNENEWKPGRYYYMSKDAKASDKYLDVISNYTNKLDIPVFSMFPAFRAYNFSKDKPLYFAHDAHWTTEGHKLFAAELEKFISEQIPWCKS